MKRSETFRIPVSNDRKAGAAAIYFILNRLTDLFICHTV